MYFGIRTIIALSFLVALILFQIVLSKRENKWAGLIIPMISFGLSIIGLLGMPYYLALSGSIIIIILKDR